MVIFKLEPEDLDPPPPYIEDEDYDVYLFYPSISTCVLVPVDGAPVLSLEATNGLAPATNTSEDLSPAYTSLASDVDSQSLDELDVVSCCLPVRSSSVFLPCRTNPRYRSRRLRLTLSCRTSSSLEMLNSRTLATAECLEQA